MELASESGEEKRRYHSLVRQRQAEETRRRILAAARELFESRGYALTTLEAIAEQALVSPKTVAAVFGSKRALLAEVVNPDAFSTLVQQLIEELRTTEDLSRRLSLVAQITRQAYEPLISELELLTNRVSCGMACRLRKLLTCCGRGRAMNSIACWSWNNAGSPRAMRPGWRSS